MNSSLMRLPSVEGMAPDKKSEAAQPPKFRWDGAPEHGEEREVTKVRRDAPMGRHIVQHEGSDAHAAAAAREAQPAAEGGVAGSEIWALKASSAATSAAALLVIPEEPVLVLTDDRGKPRAKRSSRVAMGVAMTMMNAPCW
ncbi:hypothetical protein HU200_005251 [Digitaria exilis]|uniref:Uncharacterized protein n=1 Tax=Digitaria exilis TaxID=1010633 RepID=A0A835FRV2_9POAL|nr:hypothetical protein HU200_005251 [Digitaria exilis]